MYIVYQQIYLTLYNIKCLFIFSCRGMWTKKIVYCAPWGRRLFGCLPKFSCTWEVNSVHSTSARSTWFDTTSLFLKGVRKNAKSNMPFLLRKHASPVISRTCGILWDSEGLNWLRWTGRNILPRTIALNKWINQILFVLWLMCLFCLFSCRLNISRSHQIMKTCHHPVLLLTLCHPLTTLQMTLPILVCLWQ